MLEFIFGRRYRHLENQMSILGHRLGIPAVKPPGGWKPFMNNFPRIKGTLMGRDFHLHIYTKGSGKNKRTFMTFTLSVANKYEYTLTLYKERLWSKIGKMVGMQDIEVGDPPFDKNFIVKSNDDYFAQEVLKDKQTKDYFMYILPGMYGEFNFVGQEISFKQEGIMRYERDRVQIEHTIETALILAEKIEKFANDRDTTRW